MSKGQSKREAGRKEEAEAYRRRDVAQEKEESEGLRSTGSQKYQRITEQN